MKRQKSIPFSLCTPLAQAVGKRPRNTLCKGKGTPNRIGVSQSREAVLRKFCRLLSTNLIRIFDTKFFTRDVLRCALEWAATRLQSYKYIRKSALCRQKKCRKFVFGGKKGQIMLQKLKNGTPI